MSEKPFTVETREYLYEPEEYTEEELLQMETEWAEREGKLVCRNTEVLQLRKCSAKGKGCLTAR